MQNTFRASSVDKTLQNLSPHRQRKVLLIADVGLVETQAFKDLIDKVERDGHVATVLEIKPSDKKKIFSRLKAADCVVVFGSELSLDYRNMAYKPGMSNSVPIKRLPVSFVGKNDSLDWRDCTKISSYNFVKSESEDDLLSEGTVSALMRWVGKQRIRNVPMR